MAQRLRIIAPTLLGGTNIIISGKGVCRVREKGGEMFDKAPYELYHNQGVVPSSVVDDTDDYVKIWAGGPEAGNDEQQKVALDAVPDSGNAKLSFGGQTTAALDHDSSEAAIKSALEGLSSIGSGNIEVTGSFLDEEILVKFIDDLGKQDVGAITVVDNNLLDGATPVVATVTVEDNGSVAKPLDPDMDLCGVYQLVSVGGYTSPGGNSIKYLEKVETVRNKNT